MTGPARPVVMYSGGLSSFVAAYRIRDESPLLLFMRL